MAGKFDSADSFDSDELGGGLDSHSLGLGVQPLRRRSRDAWSMQGRRIDDDPEAWISEAERRMGFGRFGLAPLPFEPLKLQPKERQLLRTMPQVALVPPYRLQIGPSPLRVHDLQMGTQSLFTSPGFVAATSFSINANIPSVAPAGLMLLDGPVLKPGMVVNLYVENPTCVVLELEATLWGVPAWSAHKRDEKLLQVVRELLAEAASSGRPPKAERCAVCHCYGVHSPGCVAVASRCPECGTVGQFGHAWTCSRLRPREGLEQARELLRARGELPPAPLCGPALPLELEQERQRRNADRDATRAHLEAPAAGLELESDSGQWSTACDES